jgi:hypothetical protein
LDATCEQNENFINRNEVHDEIRNRTDFETAVVIPRYTVA